MHVFSWVVSVPHPRAASRLAPLQVHVLWPPRVHDRDVADDSYDDYGSDDYDRGRHRHRTEVAVEVEVEVTSQVDVWVPVGPRPLPSSVWVPLGPIGLGGSSWGRSRSSPYKGRF